MREVSDADELPQDEGEELDGYPVLGDDPVPDIVAQVAEGHPAELVWRSELGGLTFRTGHRYIKWYPRAAGVRLTGERDRLAWISTRHPAPRVVAYGSDGAAEWLVTEALPG